MALDYTKSVCIGSEKIEEDENPSMLHPPNNSTLPSQYMTSDENYVIPSAIT